MGHRGGYRPIGLSTALLVQGSVHSFKLHIPTLLGELIPKVPPAAPPVPREPMDFILKGWDKADLKRLRLTR